MDLVAYAVNGWDRQTADANVTWGGRFGYQREGFSGGLSAISGKEMDADAGLPFTRTVFDADLSYLAGAWIFGGEFNRGHVSLPADGEADWTAFLVMGHVDFNGWSGLTLRYDWFDDGDAWVFSTVGGEVQTRRSFTVAPTFVLDEGFGALVELRVDKSDQDAFVDGDGEPTDTAVSVAVEMTYSW